MDIANIAQDAGIKALAVHGRTRACGFKGAVEYDTIAAIKHTLDIPVIANGDINTAEDATNILAYTNADGLMIGRGAQGNPWLFQQIQPLSLTFLNSKMVNQLSSSANMLKPVGDNMSNPVDQDKHKFTCSSGGTAPNQVQEMGQKDATNVKEGAEDDFLFASSGGDQTFFGAAGGFQSFP